MTPIRQRPLFHLTRHFFEHLFDLGFLSESRVNGLPRILTGLAGVLLALGILLTRVFLTRYRLLNTQPDAAVYLEAFLTDHAFLLAVPMWIVAFVSVLAGPSLFPDETDYRVLMATPASRRLVFGAKLTALVLFVGMFMVMTLAALLPLVTLTLVGRHVAHDAVPALVAFLVAAVAGCAFASLAVTTVHAVVLLLVPRRFLLGVAAAAGSVMLFALVAGLPFIGHIPSFEQAFTARTTWLFMFPPAWFTGLEQWLLGEWRFALLASSAVAACACVLGISALAYAVLYRHFDRVLARPAADSPPVFATAASASGRELRKPVFTAIRAFTLVTLRRSVLHQGVLVGLAAIGAAIVVNSLLNLDLDALTSASLRRQRHAHQTILWLPFVLIFVMTFAVRASLLIPVEVRANWIFRTTERDGVRTELLGAATWTMVVFGVLLPVVLLLPLQWMAFEAGAIVTSLATVLCGVLLVELSVMNWRRIPFTCSYFADKGFLPVTLMKAFLAFVLFTALGVAVASFSRAVPPFFALGINAAILTAAIVLGRARRHLQLQQPLEFEDSLPTEVSTLKLSAD